METRLIVLILLAGGGIALIVAELLGLVADNSADYNTPPKQRWGLSTLKEYTKWRELSHQWRRVRLIAMSVIIGALGYLLINPS